MFAKKYLQWYLCGMTDEEHSQTLDAGALKALAHPLRVKILDLLIERGPQTASTLATLVGETSGSMSYHLRALAAHDLIREVEGRGRGRERWWERRKGRLDLPSPDRSMSPASRAAAQIVTSEFFRLRHESLMAFLNRDETTVPQEWLDTSLVMSTFLDITAEQMLALRDEVMRVIDEARDRYRGQTGPGVRRVAVRAELFDLPVGPSGTVAQKSAEHNEEPS